MFNIRGTAGQQTLLEAGDSVETTRVFNIRGTAGRSQLCAQWQANSATKITTTKASLFLSLFPKSYFYGVNVSLSVMLWQS